MDRPIDSQEVRLRKVRRIAVVAAAFILAATGILGMTGWVRPRVRRADIRTARVDSGPVEATITAAGLVVPEYETVIVSPVDTRVSKILRKPGDTVSAGEAIVALDRSGPEAALRKLDDQIALQRNSLDQARLTLENTLIDLKGRLHLKEIEKKSLQQEKERNDRLVQLGAMSRQATRTVETDLEKVEVEISQLAGSIEVARADLDTRLKGLDLEISILKRDREEAARRLTQAAAHADRAGVVTWVVAVEGSSVRQGEEIARIADLGSYRVEATVADVHSGRIARGMPVRVRVGEQLLAGRLTSVRPTVQNGVITVEAALDQPSFPALRPNLRVDVHVITEQKTRVARLPRGTWLTVDGEGAVFVVHGDRASRRMVEFGIQSFDSCEVVEGLEEGEEVILSDMSDYRDAREVLIR